MLSVRPGCSLKRRSFTDKLPHIGAAISYVNRCNAAGTIVHSLWDSRGAPNGIVATFVRSAARDGTKPRSIPANPHVPCTGLYPPCRSVHAFLREQLCQQFRDLRQASCVLWPDLPGYEHACGLPPFRSDALPQHLQTPLYPPFMNDSGRQRLCRRPRARSLWDNRLHCGERRTPLLSGRPNCSRTPLQLL